MSHRKLGLVERTHLVLLLVGVHRLCPFSLHASFDAWRQHILKPCTNPADCIKDKRMSRDLQRKMSTFISQI